MISLIRKKITVTYLHDKKQLYFYDILGIESAIHYAFVNAINYCPTVQSEKNGVQLF